jgi:hypothetical protein
MKKNLITLLLVFTVINTFGQAPTTSKTGKNIYSNNKELTVNDIVTNKAIKPLTKVPLDEALVLIYDYDGSLFAFDLESETIAWTVKATDNHTEMCANQVTLLD